jgi:hypothetical protein
LSGQFRNAKPTRIFYVSDFDRAGDAMPRQVSRQIEFWQHEYAPDMELRLLPIVLTREQVDRYNLPNVPGESAKHNAGFEARQGRGVVELDALEALVPGQLAAVVTEALGPYWDATLPERLRRAEADARTTANRQWDELTASLRAEVADVTSAVEAITERYEPALSQLAERLDEELAPLRERLEALETELQDITTDFAPDLPERPGPHSADDDDGPWLFDSNRDYLEQLRWYHRHKSGGDEEES